jgi:hypothetical protein
MMLITLDNLAARYHCLPSEALERATTFDLHVLDVSARWEQHKINKENHKGEPPKLTQEQMLEMVAKAKAKA